MKRLTEKEQDYYRLKDYQDPCKAIDQLGRYEDIGFSPEELQEMVDRQKWHVMAEGDLPKKIIDEYGIPVEYIVMIAGAEEPTTAVMDEDGEWYDVAFEYYNIPGSEKDYFNVVAWRELPEPWEGANNE